MDTSLKTYVQTDEHGVLRVGATRVMLDSVIASFQRGDSPEFIRQQYPSLSLEEVYGAITYCLAHRKEIESYLRRQETIWNDLRARSEETSSPTLERIRALKREQASRPR